MRDSAVALGDAALYVVSRAKRSLSVSSLSNGAARRINGGKAGPPPVNRVRRIDSRRTADRHGQSRAENIILSESLRYLHRWPCLFLSTGCDGTSERRQRARINRLKKHIAINQRRAGMPAPYYVDVRESTPELHAHIVAAFPTKAAALDFGSRLERSPTYGAWICGQDDGRDAWQLVHNWDGIFNYLSKEATRTAQVAARNRFRRVPVAHRSGSVSGDRVRPSEALERELGALGSIEPRTRTYAARMLVPVAAKPIAAEFCEALKNRPPAAERPMSTAEFPDALKAVVSEAAKESRAQSAHAREPMPPKGRFITGDSGTGRAGTGESNPLPEQLALPMVAPVINLAAIAEAKRKDLGISQREAARRLGIGQPHWCNSLNRKHDTLSPWARNRLREWVADRVAA